MNRLSQLWNQMLMVFSIVVSLCKTPTPPLSKAEMRRRRRMIDADRLERQALCRSRRNSHGRQNSRHRNRGSAHKGIQVEGQIAPLPEPLSLASLKRTWRRRQRRKAGSTEVTLEIQRNQFSGDWEILHLDQEQPLSLQTSKKRALVAAEKHLREEGGGKILVLDDTGEVIKEKPVAARKDKPLAIEPIELSDELWEELRKDFALLFG